MQKRFIVRLKKNGEIVANSQIITINGLGPSTVTANDFTDRTVRQNITTVSGQASLRKTVVSPEWTIIVANPAVVGGNKLNLIWTTTRKTVDTVSWFAVYPDTLIIYSGPALDNTGKKYNLFTPNLSGNFTIQTEVIGIEQQLQIVLMNGDLTTGTLLARSDTVTVGALQLKVSGTNRIVAGNAVTVKVEGAPYEIVTYTGETSGQITLNDKGVFTGSITENVSLPLGVFIWTFDGSVTDNVTQFTVRITSGRALSVSGPTKVARGKPFTVLVNGEPGDRVKALPTGARLGQPPLYFVLAIAGANAGTAQADISNGGNLAVGTYTWAFEGETSKPLVNYSVTVENFTLSVSGQAQALENSRVEARISGAPREIVTISREGTTPFTRELLDDGNLSLDLNADRTLTSGTYTWEFDGDRTFNTPNPTLTTNIVSEYMIFVNDADGYTFSDTYVYGQPINVSIIGAPLENITISKTGGGSVTKSLDIFGSIGHNLNPTNNLPLGIHNWTFTGTVSDNIATWTANIVNIKTLTVTPASPLTILANVAANITVDANPYEIVSSERAGWEVVNITCLPDGTGRGDLFKGRRPPLGSYIFYLTGTKAPNKRLRYEVVVSSAPPPPPTPTYKMRARNGATNVEITSVNEGGSVKFELETYGATLGNVEPYTISLVGGFNSADIQVTAFLTGTLKVGDDNYNPATLIGFASRVIGITADEVTEGIEYIKMSLTNHPTANVQIAINDTSKTQLAVIRHRPNTNRVREGEIAQFDVITQNVPNGKTLYWRVMKAAGYPAIVAADLVNGLIGVGQSLLRGSFTITADNTTGVGSGSFQFTVATDGVIDPDEAFHVQVWRIESLPTSQIGITAQPISIIDADSPSQDYEITNFYIISTVEQCIDAMWSTNGSIIAHEVRYTPNSFTYNNQNNFQAYAIVNVNNAVFTANSFGPIPVGLQTESGFTHTFRLIVTGVDGTTKYLDHTALIRHPSGLVNYGVTTLNNVPFIVNEGDEIDLIVDSNASGAVYITFAPAGQVTITNGTSSGALSLNVISGRWQKSIRVRAIDDNIWIGDRVVNVEVRTTSLTGTIRKSVPLTILEDDVRFANWVVIPTPNALYGTGNRLKYQVKIPEDQYQAILDGQQTTFSWFHVFPNTRTLYTGPSLPVASRQGTMFISYGLTLTAGFRIYDYVPNSGLHNAPLIGTQEQFELIIVRENNISGNLIARSQVCTVNDAPITFLTLQATIGLPALIERTYNGKAAFNLPEGRSGDLILNVKGSGVAIGDTFNYRISGTNITNADLSPGLTGTFTISSSLVNGYYISTPIMITALSDGALESIEYAEVGITSGLLQGLTANIFIVIERTPIITYPATSYHGTPFTWSIQNGENNGGWYAETTGDFIARTPQTPGSYHTGSPYGLDGSGNRTFNDGDWGTIGPGYTSNLGTVNITFYFSNGAIVTRPHTVFAATTTTAAPLGPVAVTSFTALNPVPYVINETTNKVFTWNYIFGNRSSRTIYWKILHNTTTDADFSTPTSGTINIDAGSISVTAATDNLTESGGTPSMVNPTTVGAASDSTNVDLRAFAIAQGWNQNDPLVYQVLSGVYVSGNSPLSPALLITGSYPGGLHIINNGYIIGCGGTGGRGDTHYDGYATDTPGTSGGDGGTAIRITSIGQAIYITNNGIIAGGGGGGGGGRGGGNGGQTGGGGGGGGGRTGKIASSGGAGGGATWYNGQPGVNGNHTSQGVGGAGGGGWSSAGGNGGDWGVSGLASAPSPNNTVFTGPGRPGGLGGYWIEGADKITLINGESSNEKGRKTPNVSITANVNENFTIGLYMDSGYTQSLYTWGSIASIQDTSVGAGTTAGPGTTAAPPPNFGNSGLYAEVYEISFGEGWKVPYATLDQVLFPTIDRYLPTSSTGTHGFNPINVGSFRSDKYSDSIYYTVVFTGNFVAPADGTFVFSGWTDDFMMVWFGSTAVNNPTSSNAVLKIKYQDPYPGTKRTGSPFTAVANTKYPIKIVYSNGPGATNTMLYISGTYTSGSATQLTETDNVGQFLYHTTPSYTFSSSQIAFFGEGYFYDSDYSSSNGYTKLINRLGMYSTRGVGQVLIYAKVLDDWSTTGKTYDLLPGPQVLVYDSTNQTFDDGNGNTYAASKYDIHKNMVVSIIGNGSQLTPWNVNPNQSQFGFTGISFPAVGAESNYNPGYAVVGYRLVIKDRNGTTVFSTTSTGIIKDYIRTGGSYSTGGGEGGPPGDLSDARLKSDIKQIGIHQLGFGLYEYILFDKKEQGVLAQEVMLFNPDAVNLGNDGYYRVNYNMLNIRRIKNSLGDIILRESLPGGFLQ